MKLCFSIFYGVIVENFLKESTWATPSEVTSPYSSIQLRIRHIVQAFRRSSTPNDRRKSNKIWR